MRIFVSWSKDRSKHLSEIFSTFLPAILQNVEVFVSHRDLDVGVNWNVELNRELELTNFGIICITPENQNENWIHFEAGKLSKRIDDSTRLIPICYDMELTELVRPLSQFQAKEFDVSNIELIFKSINRALPTPLAWNLFDLLFAKFKEDIVKHIDKTLEIDAGDKPEKRSDRSMLEEALLLLRRQKNPESGGGRKLLFKSQLKASPVKIARQALQTVKLILSPDTPEIYKFVPVLESLLQEMYEHTDHTIVDRLMQLTLDDEYHSVEAELEKLIRKST